jgi:hypothetical protein
MTNLLLFGLFSIDSRVAENVVSFKFSIRSELHELRELGLKNVNGLFNRYYIILLYYYNYTKERLGGKGVYIK